MSPRSTASTLTVAAAMLPTAAAATQGGGEPSSDTATELVGTGVVLIAISYGAQAMYWVSAKLGFIQPGIRAGYHTYGSHRRSMRAVFCGTRFFGLGINFPGVFDLAVGFAKETL
ncbi:hypothetical protein [Jannaschia aquimarina]|uniref:Uncharacterized protein n=1 Tax=Jannaschia aquimarina TaxID=935700 RepID=A0A0D1EPP2_9RHOB|nr:hypothetical protein [Jannaschia aquimarina]KIT17620.1 hypothetical protein jaqu_05110 [Jannaschia aquimarina]SNS80653.1 hypothetical protein SAMN05421775_102370 [Jannaschia aquimarina]